MICREILSEKAPTYYGENFEKFDYFNDFKDTRLYVLGEIEKATSAFRQSEKDRFEAVLEKLTAGNEKWQKAFSRRLNKLGRKKS